MARIKNAITKYEFQPLTEGDTGTWYELAKWITTVDDASEDTTEESGYYDGDGTPQEDIVARKFKYEFSGTYDDADPAMKYLRSIEDKIGDERKVNFRITDSDGSTKTSKATVSNIKTRGGEAVEFPNFSCTISRDITPTTKPATTGV